MRTKLAVRGGPGLVHHACIPLNGNDFRGPCYAFKLHRCRRYPKRGLFRTDRVGGRAVFFVYAQCCSGVWRDVFGTWKQSSCKLDTHAWREHAGASEVEPMSAVAKTGESEWPAEYACDFPASPESLEYVSDKIGSKDWEKEMVHISGVCLRHGDVVCCVSTLTRGAMICCVSLTGFVRFIKGRGCPRSVASLFILSRLFVFFSSWIWCLSLSVQCSSSHNLAWLDKEATKKSYLLSGVARVLYKHSSSAHTARETAATNHPCNCLLVSTASCAFPEANTTTPWAG